MKKITPNEHRAIGRILASAGLPSPMTSTFTGSCEIGGLVFTVTLRKDLYTFEAPDWTLVVREGEYSFTGFEDPLKIQMLSAADAFRRDMLMVLIAVGPDADGD